MMWFQVILTMLTPVAMLVVGLRWRKHPPRREGNGLAYRTALSEQNEDTWRFAHANLSKLWVRLGLALAALTLMVMRSVRLVGFLPQEIMTAAAIALQLLSTKLVEPAVQRALREKYGGTLPKGKEDEK